MNAAVFASASASLAAGECLSGEPLREMVGRERVRLRKARLKTRRVRYVYRPLTQAIVSKLVLACSVLCLFQGRVEFLVGTAGLAVHYYKPNFQRQTARSGVEHRRHVFDAPDARTERQ